MIYFFLVLVATLSAQTMKIDETNYFYTETVPGHKVSLEFEFPQCHKSETLDIERRNSVAELSGKKVRYVFLRGTLTGTPKNCAGKQIVTTLDYEVDAVKGLMTHVFVVVDRDVKLKKSENKTAP